MRVTSSHVRRWFAIVVIAFGCGTALQAAPATALGASPVRMTYLPGGFVGGVKKDAKVDLYLSQLDAYGINQALIELASFDTTGATTLAPNHLVMIPRWMSRTAAYNAAHGTNISVGVVMNGRLDRGLDLDNAATRANMVAAMNSVAAAGARDIQLDLEPYPTSPGFLTLLDAINTSFAAHGWDVWLSTVAPATIGEWTPAHIAAVSARVDQLDPLYYDSANKTSTAVYEPWVTSSLAYYSANTAPSARLVPVLPTYKKNRWHSPAIENMTTATNAVAASLANGSRINGAGIWWWQTFFIARPTRFFDATPDRAVWQSVTRSLPYV